MIGLFVSILSSITGIIGGFSITAPASILDWTETDMATRESGLAAFLTSILSVSAVMGSFGSICSTMQKKKRQMEAEEEKEEKEKEENEKRMEKRKKEEEGGKEDDGPRIW